LEYQAGNRKKYFERFERCWKRFLRCIHTEQGRLPAFVACCVFALLTTTVIAGRFTGLVDWATHNLTLIPITTAAVAGCFTLRIAWLQAIVLAVIFASWGYFIIFLQGVMR